MISDHSFSVRSLRVLCALVLMSVTTAHADETSDATEAAPYPTLVGGAVLDSFNRFEIPEGKTVHLSGPAQISTDEIVIRGTLVTQGYDLRAEARHVVFGPNGKIIAFDTPAKSKSQASPGAKGEPAPGRGDDDDMANGAEGGAGKQGEHGSKGYPGAGGIGSDTQPGKIRIFSGLIDGVPFVDGTGQEGGMGQQGGDGGQGGQGGKGRHRKGKTLVFGGADPGRGGHGGTGGEAGIGGEGGDGGSAVQVRFYQAHTDPALDLSKITSAPGAAGRGGDPGAVGKGGNPGAGGDGGGGFLQIGSTDGSSENLGSGSDGKIVSGQGACYANVPAGHGCIGSKGPHFDPNDPSQDRILKSFDSLERSRVQVEQAWYAVHWLRNLLFLSQDSIRVASSLQRSRSETLSSLQRSTLKITQDLAADVGKDWDRYFLTPLKNQTKGKKNTTLKALDDMSWAIATGNLFSRAFTAYASGSMDYPAFQKQLKEGLGRVENQFQLRLESAVQECQDYNDLISKNDGQSLGEISGETRFFNIPVCNGDPDFMQPENWDKEIVLSMVSSKNVNGASDAGELKQFLNRVESDAPVWLAQHNWTNPFSYVLRWIMPLAWAGLDDDDAEIIVLGNKKVPVERIREILPGHSEIPGQKGLLRGYQAVPETSVKLENISLHLRVLAAQINAGGGR